jgi:opacity protein-like surface antigen
MDAQAVRVVKKFSKWLDAGVDIGSAKLQQGTNSGFGALAALNQNKPFVGIQGTARYSTAVGDKLTADMHTSLGYRFMDLNDVNTGVGGEATIDDLNAFVIGVGVGFRF